MTAYMNVLDDSNVPLSKATFKQLFINLVKTPDGQVWTDLGLSPFSWRRIQDPIEDAIGKEKIWFDPVAYGWLDPNDPTKKPQNWDYDTSSWKETR